MSKKIGEWPDGFASIREQTAKVKAYQEGQEAVRRKPLYAPSNPYEEETDPVLHQAWEDGAESAGLFGPNGIYTNGVLNKSER